MQVRQIGLLAIGATLITAGIYFLMENRAAHEYASAAERRLADQHSERTAEIWNANGRIDGEGAVEEGSGNGKQKLSEKYGDGWKKKYEFNLTGKPVDVDRLDEYLDQRDTSRIAKIALVAAHHQDFETIEKIIETGAAAKSFDDWLFNEIGRRAIYDKKLETLRWALSKGMSPDEDDPIVFAAKSGPQFVHALFEAGLDPNGDIAKGSSEELPILAFLAKQVRFEEKYLKAFRLALDYGGRRPERFDLYARSDWDELVAKAMALDMSDVYATRDANRDVSPQDSERGER